MALTKRLFYAGLVGDQAISGGQGLEAGRPQHALDGTRHGRVVVDDEHAPFLGVLGKGLEFMEGLSWLPHRYRQIDEAPESLQVVKCGMSSRFCVQRLCTALNNRPGDPITLNSTDKLRGPQLNGIRPSASTGCSG